MAMRHRFILAAAMLALPGQAVSGAPLGPSRDDGGLRVLQSIDQRVADVSWKLASANASFCAQRMGSLGIAVHDAAQYGKRDRPAVIRSVGFGDGLPAVLAVAKEGPAARGGLRQGDRIVALNGVALGTGPVPPRARENYASIAAVMARLEDLPEGQPAMLDILRRETPMRLSIPAAAVCRSRVEVVPNGGINASSNGLVVQIEGKLALWTKNDDELALVIAHEMAHNILDHNDRIAKERIGTGILASLGIGAGKLRDFEREADRLGLYLAARAGYDYRIAPAFWSRLSSTSGLANVWASTHPTGAQRARFNEVVLDEIVRKKAAGEDLIP